MMVLRQSVMASQLSLSRQSGPCPAVAKGLLHGPAVSGGHPLVLRGLWCRLDLTEAEPVLHQFQPVRDRCIVAMDDEIARPGLGHPAPGQSPVTVAKARLEGARLLPPRDRQSRDDERPE